MLIEDDLWELGVYQICHLETQRMVAQNSKENGKMFYCIFVILAAQNLSEKQEDLSGVNSELVNFAVFAVRL